MVDQIATTLFNDIYDATNSKVLVYITAKCSNTHDISDIFQEIYMELYSVLVKRGDHYIKNNEAFVMNLTKQKVFRYYSLFDRLKKCIPIITLNDLGEEINLADFEYEVSPVEDSVIEKDLIAQIHKFLSKKPEAVKKIFYLFYYLDQSIPEIAKLLSMSESNVKNKLYRTLAEVRRLYTEKDGAINERKRADNKSSKNGYAR